MRGRCFLVWDLANPDSKVHVANMGPIWGRQDPGGPYVGPMNFAIWEAIDRKQAHNKKWKTSIPANMNIVKWYGQYVYCDMLPRLLQFRLTLMRLMILKHHQEGLTTANIKYLLPKLKYHRMEKYHHNCIHSIFSRPNTAKMHTNMIQYKARTNVEHRSICKFMKDIQYLPYYDSIQYDMIPSIAIITQSNIVRYCINNCRNCGRI